MLRAAVGESSRPKARTLGIDRAPDDAPAARRERAPRPRKLGVRRPGGVPKRRQPRPRPEYFAVPVGTPTRRLRIGGVARRGRSHGVHGTPLDPRAPSLARTFRTPANSARLSVRGRARALSSTTRRASTAPPSRRDPLRFRSRRRAKSPYDDEEVGGRVPVRVSGWRRSISPTTARSVPHTTCEYRSFTSSERGPGWYKPIFPCYVPEATISYADGSL